MQACNQANNKQTNESFNELINQSINQTINQSILTGTFQGGPGPRLVTLTLTRTVPCRFHIPRVLTLVGCSLQVYKAASYHNTKPSSRWISTRLGLGDRNVTFVSSCHRNKTKDNFQLK